MGRLGTERRPSVWYSGGMGSGGVGGRGVIYTCYSICMSGDGQGGWAEVYGHVEEKKRKTRLDFARRRERQTRKNGETKFSGANADREIFIFPVQLLTTCRIGNLTRLIHTLAMCVTIHTYKHSKVITLRGSVEPAKRHELAYFDEPKKSCTSTRQTETCVAPI